MFKTLPLFITATVLFIYLFQISYKIINSNIRINQLEIIYKQKSFAVLHKYDSLRNFGKINPNKIKISTNTYIKHDFYYIDDPITQSTFKEIFSNATATTFANEYNNFNTDLEDYLKMIQDYYYSPLLAGLTDEGNDTIEGIDISFFTYTIYKPPYKTSSRNAPNCTILMLVRNWEVDGALKTIRALEDRFNKNHRYDWVFLNDEPFTLSFIRSTSSFVSSGKIKYGIIPKTHWNPPVANTSDKNGLNMTAVNLNMESMEKRGVLYGGVLSYRNMCRFQSMKFYKHPAMLEYEYYMRAEPNVEYFCDFHMDPFEYLYKKNAKYGFVISMYEYEDTIPTLWETVENFIEGEINDGCKLGNCWDFITDSGIAGKYRPVVASNSDYNLCHFWSNFEVGSLSFYRSEKYNNFVAYLDNTGGFYYERWGDAPIHTIGALMLLNEEEIVHFDTIGYYHAPFGTCPNSENIRLQQKCICDPTHLKNIDIQPNSCLMRWWKHGGGKKFTYF
ncbi:mannosyltransferase YUR1 SCDLUD_002615 [Saccharomycodes ludwigii]|uniref:mannosyltransferase YUR1 n=1 Tax=Saccharomycodes ludwigii TaxID=36035 RepID=UPI001E89EAD8|nr:hypothetical protein SCDLUD_002615 [Saccharomycodes ludwigii]KAH3901133.1 hypothetical protein SCDLUD_002615 [Saccharomycodes ludwigii]